MNYENVEFSKVRHDLKNSIRRIDLIFERIDEFIDEESPVADKVIGDMEKEVLNISELWNKFEYLVRNNNK